MSEPRYSICCNALPLGELDDTPMDGKPLYTGRCSMCQDGSEFLTQSEGDAWEQDEQEWYLIPKHLPEIPMGDEQEMDG